MKLNKEQLQQKQVFCGFPTTGKSYHVLNSQNTVDLDGPEYTKDITREEYVILVKKLVSEGKTVFTPSYADLREELQRQGVDYVFITYAPDMKDVVKNRSDERQPHLCPTSVLMDNWDNFRTPMSDEDFYEINSDVHIHDLID